MKIRRYGFLAVCTVFLALVAMLPFYAEDSKPVKEICIDIPEYLAPTPSPDDAEIIKLIEAAAGKFEDAVDISEYEIPYDAGGIARLTACYNSVRYEHVEFFWLSGTYTVSVSKNTVVMIKFKYSEDKEAAKEDLLVIEKNAKKALDTLRADMTDVEKALALHDYIVLHSEYDSENYLSYIEHDLDDKWGPPPESYNLKGIMIYGIGVCQSYSYSYKYLLAKVGIRSELISSDSMGHMWNAVKIGDKWYNVDVTWDDPTWDRFGRVNHNYFLCSDSDFGTSNSKHKSIHEDWKSNVVCDSTVYDNEIWIDSASAIPFDAENMYVSKPDGDIIACKRSDHTKTSVIYSVEDMWKISDALYYPGSYSKLAVYKSRIYLSLSKTIISFKPDGTDVKTEFTSDVNIWGTVLDDNVLYYAAVNDYYADGMKTLKSTGSIKLGSPSVSDIFLVIPQYRLGVGQKIPISFEVNEDADGNDVILTLVQGSDTAALEGNALIPVKTGSVTLRAESKNDASVYDEISLNIECVFGDGDGNGVIDIADLVLLTQYLAGWEIDFAPGTVTDLTLDGKTDIVDAVLLAQYLAGYDVFLCTPKQ